MVVVGHSAGGQFVNRYAAGTQVHDKLEDEGTINHNAAAADDVDAVVVVAPADDLDVVDAYVAGLAGDDRPAKLPSTTMPLRSMPAHLVSSIIFVW